MASVASSDMISRMKPLASEGSSASIPWKGVSALSSHWAGAGSLYDWVRPDDFGIARDWAPEVVRARMAEAALLHIQSTLGKHLPRHAGEWLDLIGQQTQRAVEYVDTPSAHTDWQATIAVFGRYPVESYIEKRPVYTHDTSFTRLLKWTATSIARAESLVWAQFGRRALQTSMRQRFSSALELPEVATAADELEGLSDYDRDACRQSGGVWLVLARIAEILMGLWTGSASAQLLALRPILPDFAHQLFELGTLGTISSQLKETTSEQVWTSRAPFAAAHGGRPSLSLDAKQGEWHAFYQTVPRDYRRSASPYVSVTKDLDGAPLRPDIWIEQTVAGKRTELVLECKYSLSPSYVSTGVTQCFAYEVEFPPQDGARRLHVVVGPEEVVARPRSWGGRFAVADPSSASELCAQAFVGHLETILTAWEK
jgi:hypothetical protein